MEGTVLWERHYNEDVEKKFDCKDFWVGMIRGRSHSVLLMLGNDHHWYMDVTKKNGNYWEPLEAANIEEAKRVVEVTVRME